MSFTFAPLCNQAAAPQTIGTFTPVQCTIAGICPGQAQYGAAAPQTLPPPTVFTPVCFPPITAHPFCPPQAGAAAPQTIGTITPVQCTVAGICPQQAGAAAPQTLPPPTVFTPVCFPTLTAFPICPPQTGAAAAPQTIGTITPVQCTIAGICPGQAGTVGGGGGAAPQGLTVFTLCTPVCNTLTPVKC